MTKQAQAKQAQQAVSVTPTSYQGKAGKVKCAVPGCSYEGHILLGHVRDDHGLDAGNYAKLYPYAPMFSDMGKVEYEKRSGAQAQAAGLPSRTKKMFSVADTFGLDMREFEADGRTPVVDATGKQVVRDRMVSGFETPTEWTPKLDPGYVFPQEETLILLMGMARKDRILVTGGTGTGKTSLLEQVCARLNFSCVKFSFDGEIGRNDLIGEWVVKGKEMVFQYGLLVLAFQMPGTVIIFDEWDTIRQETSFVIQRPLQKEDGKLLIMETGGELVQLHEDNVICATANTVGQGDETGLYSHGTRIQNYSQINRFGLTIKMNYLNPTLESEMLHKRFPDLEKPEVAAFIAAINKVRDGYENQQISVPLSPRDLIQWVSVYMAVGDPMKAAKYCFLNRMSTEDAAVTAGIVQRAFEQAP